MTKIISKINEIEKRIPVKKMNKVLIFFEQVNENNKLLVREIRTKKKKIQITNKQIREVTLHSLQIVKR